MRPSAKVIDKDSEFIHAIIKIFPVSAHCAIAGTRPSELKVTAANCSGVATMTLPSALLGVWS
jgi:hypothetical protein